MRTVSYTHLDVYKRQQTEYEQCINAIASTNYVTIHVFPMACESIGHMIGDAIKLRYKNGNSEPLDLLFCVNFVYPGEIFKKYILERLTPEEAAFMEEHVGFVESLVFRLGADPVSYTHLSLLASL